MTIPLTPVRYFTDKSPYHYTEDNKPLTDLAARDEAIVDAIGGFTDANQTVVATGNWTSILPIIDCTALAGKPFALRVRVWGIEDQSIAVSQNSTLAEDLLFGQVSVDGTAVTIFTTVNKFKHGANVQFNHAYATVTGGISVSFTVYAGANGYAKVKVEQFNP